ncbi:unnamed protein product, partial [Sphenostylis stenocarpa]
VPKALHDYWDIAIIMVQFEPRSVLEMSSWNTWVPETLSLCNQFVLRLRIAICIGSTQIRPPDAAKNASPDVVCVDRKARETKVKVQKLFYLDIMEKPFLIWRNLEEILTSMGSKNTLRLALSHMTFYYMACRYFNSLQSECFPICFHSDVNMVISAPTGSGKTVLFELCMLRLLSRFISAEGRFLHVKGSLKTIYIAPSKALVQEKLRDWNKKFGPWGIHCLELTGDNESYTPRNILEADIILTTPEKFDAVSRYGIESGGLSFFSDIALLLMDEVHLLNDPRGAVLEAIVSRIKIVAGNPKLKSNPLAQVRYLAVSATIPNIEDLGYAPAKNDFLFEKVDILMQYSRGKSALVFCSTRKGAQEAAQRLSQIVMTFGLSNPFIKNREQQDRLREASISCTDKQMQSYVLYGVGYHNGGLCLKDRNIVEGLFLKGDIQISSPQYEK